MMLLRSIIASAIAVFITMPGIALLQHCSKDSCSQQMHYVAFDAKLNAAVHQFIDTVSMMNCLHRCMRVSVCKSLNVKKVSENVFKCELLSVTQSSGATLTDDTHWQHYEMMVNVFSSL